MGGWLPAYPHESGVASGLRGWTLRTFRPMRRAGTIAAVGAILAIAGPAFAEVVSTLPGGNWTVLPDTTEGGSAEVVKGPGTPPAGTGSLRLTVETTADRALVGTDLGSVTTRPFSALSAEYSTYVPNGSPESFTPTLRFAAFQTVTPAPQNFTTVSFEPLRNGTVIPGQWQTWALGPDSQVWQTNATDNGFCVQASPCTLGEFSAHYPNSAWGQAQLGLGSGVAGPAEGFADAVTLTDGDTTQFTDFDPPAEPNPAPKPALPDTGTADVPNIGLVGVSLAMIGAGLVLLTRVRQGARRP
jgi:LPXTG-motif cell wall-anchored protein